VLNSTLLCGGYDLKTEGKVWILFDSVGNKKSKPLSVVQMQMMLLTLKVSTLHQYFIWTPGWDEWVTLPVFLGSGQKYFVQAQPPEPLFKKEKHKEQQNRKSEAEERRSHNSEPQLFTEVLPSEPMAQQDYGYYYTNFTGDDLTLSGAPETPMKILISKTTFEAELERRRTKRHELKLEAVLVTKKGTSFRTHSKNISMTGTLLEDEIPKDFFNRPFEMILINRSIIDPKKNRVHLTGRIVGDLSDPRRLAFVEQDEEVTEKLGALLNDYAKLQAQRLKKTAG
jgi:hypothetical protein